MKKYALYVLCGILILSAVIMPECTYKIHSTQITQALENKDFYGQNDILVKVYEFECEEGVGGVVFDVSYDGDNLDFYDVAAESGYTAVYRDNHVGKLTVGIADKSVTKAADTKTSIKIAVGFKTLYMLDSSYISFSYIVKDFADGNIKKSNYSVSESFYVYDDDADDIEYEEYVRDIIGIDLDDTDTETDSDTKPDTDINTETDSDTKPDTDINTETDSDTKPDTDINTETDSDTKPDTDINTETDSDTKPDTDINTKTDSDTKPDTDINTETDSDTKPDTDINTETDSDTKPDTDINTETDSDTKPDTDSETETDIDTDIPTTVKYICGDVDNDGTVTSADALLVLRNSVELEYFTPVQVRLGDVDRDGEITSADSLEILRYSVGIYSDSGAGKTILI